MPSVVDTTLVLPPVVAVLPPVPPAAVPAIPAPVPGELAKPLITMGTVDELRVDELVVEFVELDEELLDELEELDEELLDELDVEVVPVLPEPPLPLPEEVVEVVVVFDELDVLSVVEPVVLPVVEPVVLPVPDPLLSLS